MYKVIQEAKREITPAEKKQSRQATMQKVKENKQRILNDTQILTKFNYLMCNVESFRAAVSTDLGQLAWRNHRENECIVELYAWLYMHVDLLRELLGKSATENDIVDFHEAHRIIKETHNRMVNFKCTANQAIIKQINWEKDPDNNRNKFK